MRKPDPVVLIFLTSSSPNHHFLMMCFINMRILCSREILLFYFLNFSIRRVHFTTTAGRFFDGKHSAKGELIKIHHKAQPPHKMFGGLAHCKFDENLLFDSWLWLISHQVPRRKIFELIIIFFTSCCSNKVNSVNFIVIRLKRWEKVMIFGLLLPRAFWQWITWTIL